MKTAYDVIRKPVISEKSMDGARNKIYTFEVATDATKTEIKYAIEEIFKVKVDTVNVMNIKGKIKRMGVHVGPRPDRRKAIVKLSEQSKPIEFFEGMM
ncbi:MAG: 50S ribosomal protein L23 [Bacillota bacterium]|nr:50S ribosomal protein L23 [Bacillota bacterium]